MKDRSWTLCLGNEFDKHPERNKYKYDIQDVMEVENTVSPETLVGAPKDLPRNDWPVLRCNTPGIAEMGPE